MDVHFYGFAPLVPVWILAVLGFAAAYLVWHTYRGYTSIQTGPRTLFMVLRGTSALVLLLLLLNPVMQWVRDDSVRPRILVMIDNSQSMAIEKGEWSGKASLDEVLEVFNPENWPDLQISFQTFSPDEEPVTTVPELTLDSPATDLSNVLRSVAIEDQSDAVFLLSDGISTIGRDPIFEVIPGSIPIHSVITGDSTRVRDLVVQHVDAPATAFVNQTVPVRVLIRNDGFPDQSINVLLRSDGNTIEQVSLQTGAVRSVQQVTFQLPLLEEGLQRFEILIPTVDGEWTSENNTQRFSIEVREGRSRIVHIATEIHPDVGYMRRLLSDVSSFDVEFYTWITGTRFLEGRLPSRRDTLDLVVLHGLGRNIPDALALELRSFTQDIPSVFLWTPGSTNISMDRFFSGNVPLNFSTQPNFAPYQISSVPDMAGHPILELPAVDLSRAPLLVAPATGFQQSTFAEVLVSGISRQRATPTPLLGVHQTGNLRRATIGFSDIYLWGLHPESSYGQWMDQILLNTLSWTLANSDTETFEISPASLDNQAGLPITFNATVRDDSGNPESRAEVRLQITAADRLDRTFVLPATGQGTYQISVPALPQGDYTFRATARRNELDLGTRMGEFSVASTSAELINTVRNDALMQQISILSGGVHFEHADQNGIVGQLEEIAKTATVTQTQLPFQISKSPVWFAILLILLGWEWLLRKKYALP